MLTLQDAREFADLARNINLTDAASSKLVAQWGIDGGLSSRKMKALVHHMRSAMAAADAAPSEGPHASRFNGHRAKMRAIMNKVEA